MYSIGNRWWWSMWMRSVGWDFENGEGYGNGGDEIKESDINFIDKILLI